MKRFFAVILLAVMVSSLAFAGMANAQDDPKAYFGDLVPEEGAVLTVSGWGEESEQQINLDSIARFNELYPDVEIVFEPIPNDFQTAIKAAMAGGTAPDVFYVDADLFINFSPNDLLLDLTPYMDAAGVAVADYPAGLINQWITPDGKVMGIPKDFNSLAVFYIPEYFEAAGVEMPAEGWTWDDLRAAADAITATGATVGMCTPPDVGRWPALALAAGAEIMNADYTEALFNSPEAVSSVEFFFGMYNDGIGASPADIGMGWCGEALGNKLTAMAFEGGWLVNYLDSQFADVEWAVAPMPVASNGGEGNLLFQNAWGVNAGTAYPNAAALLTLFLTSPMNQQPIAEVGFALPTHLGLLNDGDFLASLDLSSRVILSGAATGEAFFYGEHNGEVTGAMGNALNAIWLGEKDIQTALDDAVAEVNAIVAGE